MTSGTKDGLLIILKSCFIARELLHTKLDGPICRSSPVIFHRAPDLSFAHDEVSVVKTITDRSEEGYKQMTCLY